MHPPGQLLFALVIGAFLAAPVSAQTDLRRQVAVLAQEMQALQQQVGALRLEVEGLQRENASLREQVAAARAGASASSEVLAAVDVKVASLRSELVAADDANRRRIVNELSAQIEQLAKKTETSLKKLANAINAQPGSVAAPVPFTEDYPKTGLPYTVQPGDTLSGLAQKFGSKVTWIRSANKIVDPSRDLRVGATIFIPQGE